MTTKELTTHQWSTLKTQKCTNPQCATAQLFSNEVRARYYQLVFLNDKCCFDCNGYHSEHDKRRKMFKIDQSSGELKQLIDYSPEYLIDFSSFYNQKIPKSNQNNQSQQNPEMFSKTCKNFVQYLYHPANYKTLNCPFLNNPYAKNRPASNNNSCKYLYCPFLHKDQTLDPQVQRTLTNFKKKLSKSQGFKKSDPKADSKKFQDKLLNIMLLRSCKSIDDLYQKEVNLLAKSDDNQIFVPNVSYQGSIVSQGQIPAQDISEIQKIKQKLISKASQYLKIDKQRQKQQQSRKIIDKNFLKEKQTKVTTKTKLPEQCQADDLGVSYNYFKYGQKLSLIEGRTIQFKHFKDISDPNHIPLIMKYIAAFLNTEGGKLYIGIDDNSYAYGAKFKQSEYDKLLLKIDNQGKFYMTPPLMPQKYNIKLIPVYHDRKGQQRWVIEIMVFPPKEQNKKLFLYNRECYMRMNASTHKLNASDIIELMSLNSENNAQVKQQDIMVQNEQMKAVKFPNENNKFADTTSSSKRQNQLMSHTAQTKNASSKSEHKFQTEQSKLNDFEAKLKSKSIEDLYALRKDYEEKLKIIMEAYKNKERQVR